jgi:murein DD-endopeptidase MepM/ murein hydrolase activator NlpD
MKMKPERKRPHSSHTAPAKKKEDPIVRCTLARCWAAAAAVLFCFVLGKTNPVLSEQVQQVYHRLLNAPLAQSVQVWRQTAQEVGLHTLLGQMEESIMVFAGQGGQLEWNGDQLPAEVSAEPSVFSAPALHPVTGRLSCGFGPRVHPITGKNDFHTGIDIGAAAGSGIYAVWPGQVSQTGSSAIYGNFLVIDHGGGLETVYCHCQNVLAQKGAHIRAGERVAQVGSTGISTGSHLHLEIRINGKCTDPLSAFDL